MSSCEGEVQDLPSRPLTQTRPAHDRFVPEVLDGPAEEDCAEDCPTRPGEDERHEAVVEDPEEAVTTDFIRYQAETGYLGRGGSREYAQVL